MSAYLELSVRSLLLLGLFKLIDSLGKTWVEFFVLSVVNRYLFICLGKHVLSNTKQCLFMLWYLIHNRGLRKISCLALYMGKQPFHLANGIFSTALQSVSDQCMVDVYACLSFMMCE